jgi:hypothetical protein
MDGKLKGKWWCITGNHYPDEVLKTIPLAIAEKEGLSEDARQIMFSGDDEPSNHFFDGIRGVSHELAELAELDEEPYCMEHDSYCDFEPQYVVDGKKAR